MANQKCDWQYDPVKIAQSLLRCPSVTPAGDDVFYVIEQLLKPNNFNCEYYVFDAPHHDSVKNIYARFGDKTSRNLCFAGHVDVVPTGDITQWTHDPFAASVDNGLLYGRGTADMKGGIAAWLSAALQYLYDNDGNITHGALSFLITGDEEGPAVNGTKKLLEAITNNGDKLSACITGEPSNPNYIGEEIKIGRRGSINLDLEVHGIQGHIAYPHRADNAVTKMVKVCQALNDWVIDDGNDYFAPSNLEISTIDVGNEARNIIANKATALMNIRFNNEQTAQGLYDKISAILNDVIGEKSYKLTYQSNAESFLTEDKALIDLFSQSIKHINGNSPTLSTKGGTSDSRFIKDYCPVIDFGLVGKTMHQVDEHIAIDDLYTLTAIYHDFITRYFSQ